MSESAKAIFLSYASQDAEAAQRIREALRTAGLEVWLDQSERATALLLIPVIAVGVLAMRP